MIAWSISGREETLDLPANREVRVEQAPGGIVRMSPQDGKVTLKLSEMPVYVTGLDLVSQ